MPGMASIYYGDEIGMEGGRDPMNRRCFQPAQADAEIKEYYKNLLTFRQEITELKNMDLAKIQGEQDSFGFSREGDRGEVRVLIHRGLSPLEKLYERAPDKTMISGDVTFDGSRIRMNGPSCVALYFRKI